ncbi:hypothetical protein KCU98_g15148, partial [Aureobasidium melanogenum]
MCGTESSRPVLGGTIAILKSIGESTLPDLSLLFHQDEASTTTATFQSSSVPEATAETELSSCQLVIFRDGDLRASAPMTSIWESVGKASSGEESDWLGTRKCSGKASSDGIEGMRERA